MNPGESSTLSGLLFVVIVIASAVTSGVVTYKRVVSMGRKPGGLDVHQWAFMISSFAGAIVALLLFIIEKFM